MQSIVIPSNLQLARYRHFGGLPYRLAACLIPSTLRQEALANLLCGFPKLFVQTTVDEKVPPTVGQRQPGDGKLDRRSRILFLDEFVKVQAHSGDPCTVEGEGYSKAHL